MRKGLDRSRIFRYELPLDFLSKGQKTTVVGGGRMPLHIHVSVKFPTKNIGEIVAIKCKHVKFEMGSKL